MDQALIVYQNNHLDPPLSHFFVGALYATLVAVIVFCFLLARKARRAAEEAESAVTPGAPLAPGARFVAGKVELAQNETLAIQVTVTQDGWEVQHKNGKSHRFIESQRETQARPFYLRHESGARIRVEPPKKGLLLVDELDQMEWIEPLKRRRRAELDAGETAVVEGTLGHGNDPEDMVSGGVYRSAAARGWLMKPSTDGRMHVSTEGLARRHALRARAFERTLLLVLALAFAAQVPLFTYWARLILGEDVAANYMGKTSHQTRSRKGGTTTYRVWYSYWGTDVTSGDEFDEIDGGDYFLLGEKGGRIWIRRVPGHPSATAPGRGTSVGIVPWFVAEGLTVIAAILAVQTYRYRRWYEGKVIDKGSGGLPPPPMLRFANNASRKKKQKKNPRSRPQA